MHKLAKEVIDIVSMGSSCLSIIEVVYMSQCAEAEMERVPHRNKFSMEPIRTNLLFTEPRL